MDILSEEQELLIKVKGNLDELKKQLDEFEKQVLTIDFKANTSDMQKGVENAIKEIQKQVEDIEIGVKVDPKASKNVAKETQKIAKTAYDQFRDIYKNITTPEEAYQAAIPYYKSFSSTKNNNEYVQNYARFKELIDKAKLLGGKQRTLDVVDEDGYTDKISISKIIKETQQDYRNLAKDDEAYKDLYKEVRESVAEFKQTIQKNKVTKDSTTLDTSKVNAETTKADTAQVKEVTAETSQLLDVLTRIESSLQTISDLFSQMSTGENTNQQLTDQLETLNQIKTTLQEISGLFDERIPSEAIVSKEDVQRVKNVADEIERLENAQEATSTAQEKPNGEKAVNDATAAIKAYNDAVSEMNNLQAKNLKGIEVSNQMAEANKRVEQTAIEAKTAMEQLVSMVDAGEIPKDTYDELYNTYANAKLGSAKSQDALKGAQMAVEQSERKTQAQSNLDAQIEAYRKIYSLQNEIAKNSNDSSFVKKKEEEIASLRKQIEALDDVWKQLDFDNVIENKTDVIAQKTAAAQERLNKTLQKNATLSSSRQTSLLGGFNVDDIADLDTATGKIDSYLKAVTEFKKEYQDFIDSMATADLSNNDVFSEMNEKAKELRKTLQDLQSDKWNEFNATGKNAGQILPINVSDLNQARALMENTARSMGEISDAGLRWNASNTQLTFSIRNQNGELEKYIMTLDEGIQKVRLFNSGVSTAPATGFQKFFSNLGQKWKDFANWALSFATAQEALQQVQQGLQVTVDMDKAFTEMQKVSSESTATLRSFADASYGIGRSLGTTGEVIQNSTAGWMRLGESLEEASQSAQDAAILFNVSEFDSIDEATDALVSMSQAYSDLDKMEIIDRLNNVGNNFSISTDGLATALQESAAALTTAGNDIDESIALITAGNSIVQDPNSVGNGIRSIALRIQGTEEAKKQLEALGESTDDYIVATTAKLEESVKAFTAVASNGFEGVSLLDDNGNMRGTYEILQDIADIYDEIVTTDKQYGTNHEQGLLELLAGKQRANIAASILQNGDLLREVYEASQNSEGSAEEEQRRYMESIEGRRKLDPNVQKCA